MHENTELVWKPRFDKTQPSRAQRHQLTRFKKWLDSRSVRWFDVDLNMLFEYEKHLRDTYNLAPTSIRAHMSTIHARLMHLGNVIPISGSIAKRFFDFDVDVYTVTEPHSRSENVLRLESSEVERLLRAPGTNTLRGKRDSALIAVMVSTGMRSSEVTRLTVEDIRVINPQQHPAIVVTENDGRKLRVVPFVGTWAYDFLKSWLSAAAITEGPVFRGFYRGDTRLRPAPVAARTIEHVLKQYPIRVGDREVTITPLVLRRTYATIAYYYNRVEIPVLKHYLGLESGDAVLEYIDVKAIQLTLFPLPPIEPPVLGDTKADPEIEKLKQRIEKRNNRKEKRQRE